MNPIAIIPACSPLPTASAPSRPGQAQRCHLFVPGEPTAPAPFHLGHRRWLDGLRGVAILMVLAFHVKLLPGGYLGVDVFFVLSGFLITTLLVEEFERQGSISLRRFYVRRVLRLWPALFTLLAVCGLAKLLFGSAGLALPTWQEMLVAACGVMNWPNLHGVPIGILGQTWSLALEDQFYLFWPVLLYGMLRLRFRRGWIISVVCVGIVGSAAHRAIWLWQAPASLPERFATLARLYMGPDTRADSLLVGCLAGLIVAWDLLPKSRSFLRWSTRAATTAGVGLACQCILKNTMPAMLWGLFTGVALMVGAILVRLVSAPCRPATRVLESRVLVGVGRISYALYLCHGPILVWLVPGVPGRAFPLRTLLALGIAFAAAITSWYCVERPCLRLKDRLSARRVPPADPAAAADRPLPPLRVAA